MSTGKAVILGCFYDKENNLALTPIAERFNRLVGGDLLKQLEDIKFEAKKNTSRAFYGLIPDYSWTLVTGLGSEDASYCPNEERDIKKENVRSSVAAAIKYFDTISVKNIALDDCTEPKCVGEVAAISNYVAGSCKTEKKGGDKAFSLLTETKSGSEEFRDGLIYGDAQCFAAVLSNTPSNLKLPARLAEVITEEMPSNVTCITRDKNWIEENKMNLFLSVNQGSVEPAVLLEAHYKGSHDDPIVIVGKGIVFDTGGISLKPSANMGEMKADMQGAAVAFSALRAAAFLSLPLHIIAIAPFTENLPSGTATKPGDVFYAMNGKSVEVGNTDAEGRLVLGDALTYAHSFNPRQIIDLATLTGACGVALGSAASALYTKSSQMHDDFKEASAISGDRVWRMPLYEYYKDKLESQVADIYNISCKPGGGSCTAAAFLSHFVTIDDWVHLDIASTMINDKSVLHCPPGMSGRPTRTLLEYLRIQTTSL